MLEAIEGLVALRLLLVNLVGSEICFVSTIVYPNGEEDSRMTDTCG